MTIDLTKKVTVSAEAPLIAKAALMATGAVKTELSTTLTLITAAGPGAHAVKLSTQAAQGYYNAAAAHAESQAEAAQKTADGLIGAGNHEGAYKALIQRDHFQREAMAYHDEETTGGIVMASAHEIRALLTQYLTPGLIADLEEALSEYDYAEPGERIAILMDHSAAEAVRRHQAGLSPEPAAATPVADQGAADAAAAAEAARTEALSEYDRLTEDRQGEFWDLGAQGVRAAAGILAQAEAHAAPPDSIPLIDEAIRRLIEARAHMTAAVGLFDVRQEAEAEIN